VAISLCAEARKDRQRCLLGALAALSHWTDARWAAVFAGACGYQFASLREQQAVRAVERFGEADSAGIRVVQVQIRLEELFFG
jgi:hypothetical protein